MAQPTIIDSRFATTEDVAETLGVPRARVRQLMDILKGASFGAGKSARGVSSDSKKKAKSAKKRANAKYTSRRKAARAKASKTSR
jgi:hypothetical protein